MKQKFVILISILIIGCQISPINFKYETNLLEGLKKGNELNKPIFLYFTGYSCIGYDEFKEDLIKSNRIVKKLNEEFVSILLYVDDKKSIEKIDTLNLDNFLVSVNGWKELGKAKNRGNVNTIIETELFKNNSQPLYVILDSKNQILVEPFGYTNKNEQYFIRKLDKGIDAFRNQEMKIIESDKIEITLVYYGMMCDCLQWISPENMLKYEESINSESGAISEDSLFIRIEPANENVVNPFDLIDKNTENYIFDFKGQFYEDKHKWINEEGTEFNTRVFRYNECKLQK